MVYLNILFLIVWAGVGYYFYKEKKSKTITILGSFLTAAFSFSIFILIFIELGIVEPIENTTSPKIIPAKSFFKEYKENEVAADYKYKNKTIIVSGKVNCLIIESLSGKPHVLLNTGYGDFSVQCMFNKNSKELARLKPGDFVKIKGLVNGKMINVFLKNCSLI